ncbi:MAG: hypothetical protein JNL97_17760, partial [Verrucomicrobiales bacterium]|nr:hypothetical protein [Verrucomicrobiales bacterium]
MNQSPPPGIRGLLRAASAATATLRRLEPHEPTTRRLEPAIDQLQLVTEAARIESLARSTSGEAAIGRFFASSTSRTSLEGSDPESDIGASRSRSTASSKDTESLGPPAPSSLRRRFPPPPIPDDRLARMRRAFAASPPPEARPKSAPGASSSAPFENPGPRGAGIRSPERSESTLSPSQAMRTLEARSLRSPWTRTAWTSPVAPVRAESGAPPPNLE